MTGAALIGPVPASDLHVMSYNIRRPVPHLRRDHPDRWERRASRLAALLRAEGPTLLGVQEAVPYQAAFVRDTLGYELLGAGRGRDGGGEGCQLIFDDDRLELLGWDQRPLPRSPAPRIVVSATFRDRATTTEFLAVNTHLDPFSARSRVAAARVIRDLVYHQSLPAIVTGDLNAGSGAPAIRELLSGATLADGWRTAHHRLTPEWGSYGRYRPPRLDRPRIDWIAVTPTVTVDRIGVHGAAVNGGWASDHFPVQAVVRIPS